MNKKLIPIVMIAVLLPIVGVVGFSMQDDIASSMESYDDISVNNDEVNYGIDMVEGEGKIVSGPVNVLYVSTSPVELADSADLIFIGDVKSVSVSEEKDSPGDRWKMVFTYYEIEPTEVLKGTPILNENDYVLVRTLGGETENYQTLTDELQFTEGDRVFLYVSYANDEEPGFDDDIPAYYLVTVGLGNTSYIIRDDEAMKYDPQYDRVIVDTSDMLDEHKALIESLE